VPGYGRGCKISRMYDATSGCSNIQGLISARLDARACIRCGNRRCGWTRIRGIGKIRSGTVGTSFAMKLGHGMFAQRPPIHCRRTNVDLLYVVSHRQRRGTRARPADCALGALDCAEIYGLRTARGEKQCRRKGKRTFVHRTACARGFRRC